jgi:O-antigen ligase
MGTISAYLIIVKSFWFLGSWVPQGKHKTTAGSMHLKDVSSRTLCAGVSFGLALQTIPVPLGRKKKKKHKKGTSVVLAIGNALGLVRRAD